MAHEECNVGSLYNWWPHLRIANSWNQHNNYSSNSSGDVDEDVSMFTNVSNDHSGVTIESFDQSVSTNEMVGETETPVADDHQPWSQLVLSGSNGDFEDNQDVGDNLLDQFSSKNFPNDYLKKMESSGWDFTNSLLYNTNNNPLNESSSSVEQTQTLNKPSNATFNYTSIINNTIANTPFIRSHNLQTSNFPDSKKRVDQLQISYPFNRSTKGTSSTVTRRNVKAQRAPRNSSQGKKKRSSDEASSNYTLVKKPMLQRPTPLSSTKTQVPKVKLTDKITALQQIVSPFGKTDTASVLWEAICYVRFLQEQIQLLMSNPYIKSNSCKDPWGNINMEGSHDLRSRGLCLVPISFTHQIYGDNNGCDYFTPPYRGSLYR